MTEQSINPNTTSDYVREIWAQVRDKYDPTFLLELFDGMGVGHESEEAIRHVVATSKRWGYPEAEVLRDIVPASWN